MKRTITVLLVALIMLFAAGCYGSGAGTRTRSYGGGTTRSRAYNGGGYDGLYRNGGHGGVYHDFNGDGFLDNNTRDGMGGTNYSRAFEGTNHRNNSMRDGNFRSHNRNHNNVSPTVDGLNYHR